MNYVELTRTARNCFNVPKLGFFSDRRNFIYSRSHLHQTRKKSYRRTPPLNVTCFPFPINPNRRQAAIAAYSHPFKLAYTPMTLAAFIDIRIQFVPKIDVIG